MMVALSARNGGANKYYGARIFNNIYYYIFNYPKFCLSHCLGFSQKRPYNRMPFFVAKSEPFWKSSDYHRINLHDSVIDLYGYIFRNWLANSLYL